MTEKSSKRLSILSAEEIEALYARPKFSDEERQDYFALSPLEETFFSELKTIQSRIYFILQLGYFKARHRFFVFELQEVLADAQFIQARYFPNSELKLEPITKVTRLKQQALIMQLTGYRDCGEVERQALEEKAKSMARIDNQPIFILRELLQDLEQQQVIAPAYSWFQEMLGQILNAEQDRLMEIAQAHLSTEEEESLYYLLTNPNGQYEISQIKRMARHFGNKELRLEIGRGENLQKLYELAQRILPQLQISNESIKYYASLVNYYSVFQLSQLRESLALVYLLCFIHFRYQTVQDTLLKAFLYRLQRYQESAKESAQVAVYEQRILFSKNLQKAGEVLILVTDSRKIPDEGSTKQLREQAYKIIQKSELEKVAQQLSQTRIIDETSLEWQALDKLAQRFKLALRPLLRSLQIQAKAMNSPLMEAILFLKAVFERKESLSQFDFEELPMGFISNPLKKYLFALDASGKREFLVDRYEFLVYRSLRQALDSGQIFCPNSLEFRRFESDLLSDQRWQGKEDLLQEVNLPLLQIPIEEHLQDLEEWLENRLIRVNERIAARENTAVQIRNRKSRRAWALGGVK